MIDFQIDKNSEVPMHHQLFICLKERVEKGAYKPGDRLPSESEMQAAFGVSRITVRRAITDLARHGYVRKSRGKGTVVLPSKDERDLGAFTSFTGDAKQRGIRPGSIILRLEKLPADEKVAHALRIPPDEPVYLLKRLRTLNGEIISLQHTYVVSRMGLNLQRHEFDEDTSLYEYLEGHGIQLNSADESIEAFPPPNDIRHQLFLEDSDWVFYKERITYDINDTPIEYSENYYVASRYRYSLHISRIK